MTRNSFYIDIKDSILRNFDFLKSYGFNDFVENQLAYEFHFKISNNYLCIDIWFEEISSSPIWIKINQYYLENVELDNPILKNCERLRSKRYDELFELYLKKEDSIYLEKIQNSYDENGKEINESYLKESSEIIKRNIEILSGDLRLLKVNTEKTLLKNELLNSDKRIENKIYTLQYQFFPEGSIDDAYEEFSSREELDSFLSKRDDIKNYRILDWNMNKINT